MPDTTITPFPQATAAKIRGEFVTQNASFFAQIFEPLNAVFENSGAMNIISEELDITVAVAVKEANAQGEAEVDCALLESPQESLRDCIQALTLY